MSPVALRILAAGPGVTLQDGGRHGFLRFGVTAAGPMDPLAFATANAAAGNPVHAPVVEVSVGGMDATATGELSVAVAGGAFRLALDGRDIEIPALLRLAPDSRLALRPGTAGAWCYVAVAGRIDVPPVLGSVSTHTRSGLGGLDGRALAPGDELPVAEPRTLSPAHIHAPWLDRPGDEIRVLLGPQDDYFAPDQIEAFLQGPWTVSARSDRMAYLLDGPRLVHAKGFNIVSDGIAMGAIQVPGSGQPVVLMADRQPTGGYPKIANVIGADLGRLAQLRPGARFRLRAVSHEEAVEARRAEAVALAGPIRLEPLIRTDFPSEFLLGQNLIGGVTAGRDTGS
ncbi:MAG: biotin-dependent carboxyltransferase family protein [Pseudomonadota bacterium]|nr:biotin-dependent carboxyltransferase family protein [Pseudomonadota bacterium]